MPQPEPARPDPTLYLTLDIEPDYGRGATCRALDQAGPFLDWVRGDQVPVTAFVSGQILDAGHPILDRLVSAGISVELHGFSHTADIYGTMHTSHAGEIRKGTEAYVRRFNRPPAGYRAPAGVISADDLALLAQLGYRYDASIFPMRRPGRFDFSSLPRHPFRWAGLELAEFPVGLLTSRIPAGLTFTNILGPALSAFLVARATAPAGAPFVLDAHLHNLYSYAPALDALPLPIRWVYRFGHWFGGLSALRTLVANVRQRGFALANLSDTALKADTRLMPVVDMDVFTRARAP